MKKSWINSIVAASVLFAGSLAIAPAHAGLINSYDFTSDLSDTLGNGLDLVASGGTVAGGRYSFSGNQGLRLSNAFQNPNDYSIEIKFEIDTYSPFWKKVLDFQDLSTDAGLYVQGNRLQYYNTTGGGPTPISLNTDIVARITRNEVTDLMQGFVNDQLQWSFVDNGNIGVAGGNILNFFEDDFTTGQNEIISGSVDWIRIYSTVPEPSTLVLLALGLLGIGWQRMRTDSFAS